MGRSCAVPKCKSGYRGVKNKSIFKVPAKANLLKQWESVIPGLIELKSSHFICEDHFDERYIIRKYVKHDADGKVIAEVPFQHPRLDNSAIPTIFVDGAMQSCVETPKRAEDALKNELKLEDTSSALLRETKENITSNISAIGNAAPVPSALVKDHHNSNDIDDRQSVAAPNEIAATRQHLAPVAKVDIANSANQQQHLEVQESWSATIPGSKPVSGTSFDFATVMVTELNQRVDQIERERMCSAAVPQSWSVGKFSRTNGQTLVFSYVRAITKNGIDSPIVQKCVTLQPDKTLHYHVYGHSIRAEEAKLVQVLDNIEILPKILEKFETVNVCHGIGAVSIHHLQADQVFHDSLQQWHHNNCSLISKKKRCDNCSKLRKVQLQKETRFKKSKMLHRVYSSSNPVEQKKLMAMRKKNDCERRKKHRAKVRVSLLQQSLQEK